MGDAISDHCFVLQAALRRQGASSTLYARHLDDQVAGRVKVWTDYRRPSGRSLLLYHYSIGSELTNWVLHQDVPLALIYHNLTPAHYVAGYNDALAALLRQGREELPLLRDRVSLAIADSEYNRQELAELAFPHPTVLPILLNTGRLDQPLLPAIAARYQQTTNLLFVGRISPSKRQDNLIRLFAHYRHVINPDSKLILVGSANGMEVYLQQLRHLAEALGIAKGVDFVGHVPDHQLATYYRVAHVFISMSEHEGFGVPLVESMYLGVPVLALARTAVPVTLGNAGILFHHHTWDVLAELTHLLATDEYLRQRILTVQRQRLASLTPDVVLPQHLAAVGQALFQSP